MANIFIAPNGSSSGDGTIDKPYGSLQQACDLAQPGDTIFLRGGVYDVTDSIDLTRSGTPGNRITITNYRNEQPVLDGSSITDSEYILQLFGTSWTTVNGLEIRNSPHGGVYAGGTISNLVLSGLDVHHNGGGGIGVYGAISDTLILNNDSHHNRDPAGDNADGIQVSTTQTGVVIRGNRVWVNSDDGIDLFNVLDNTVSAPILVENNWAFRNGFGENGESVGNGQGFKLGGQRPNTTSESGGHVVRNNVAFDNRVHGFDENSATIPLTLTNNTSVNNGSSNYTFWAGDATLRNNVSFGTTGSTLGTNASNSWNLPVTVSAGDFFSLNVALALAPRQADGSLPQIGLFRLASGSDLLNRGQDAGLAFTGPAPDLGAYERNAAGTGSVGIGDFSVVNGRIVLSAANSVADPDGIVRPLRYYWEVSADGADWNLASATASMSFAAPPGWFVRPVGVYADPFGTYTVTASGTNRSGTNANDRLQGTNGFDTIFGLAGNDALAGAAGSDRLYGAAGNDVIFGGAGNDIVNGDAGGDNIHGHDGNDRLSGGAGNDRLYGGGGSDRLFGGTGSDTLSGGAGADLFAFEETGLVGGQRDTILDFQRAGGSGDVILFAGIAPSQVSANATAGGVLLTVAGIAGGGAAGIFLAGATLAEYRDGVDFV